MGPINGGDVLRVRPTRLGALVVAVVLVATSVASGAGPGDHDASADSRNGSSRAWISDMQMRELIWRVSQNISQDYLLSKIENLTAFGTRYVHADNHPQVIDWIYNEFQSMGYEPEKWPFTHQGDANLANVVVTVNGTGSDEFYIVCAHLDSFNKNYSWSFPNHAAPGADDDASGIAAMLAVAKAMLQYKFKYGIRFIAFDAEELYKAVGSKLYLENMSSTETQNLRGVINIDMIGYNPGYIRMEIDYTTPSLEMITDYVDPINNEFYFIPHLYKTEDPVNPNAWGDVTTFWDAGYKGITFMESIHPQYNGSFYTANTNYHTEGDTVDKLNMELMERTTRLIVGSVMMMANPTLPELYFKDIVFPKGPLFDAADIRINATIMNSGNNGASDVRVDMSIDGYWTASTNISVPAKTSVDAVFNWTTVPGNHTFDLIVDRYNTIGEWDDGNNTASRTIQVQVRPDIALENMNITEQWVNVGQLATISVAAKNNGPSYIECMFTVIDIVAPDETVFSEFVGLAVGAEWNKVFNWGSSVNGTHILEGRLSKCSPPDRVPTNNALTDTVVVNGFPVAALTAQPEEGVPTFQDMTFSATGSFDDISIDEYRFDFGDGNETGWIKLPIAMHNYSRDGRFIVTLSVKDLYGAESFPVTTQVNIANRAPVASVKADKTEVETNAPITFFSTDSFDPDGKIVRYNWTIIPEGSSSNKANPTFIISKIGNYTARLIVFDDDGTMNSSAVNFKVTNRAPKAILAGPQTVMVNRVLKFSAKSSSDPDGTIRAYYWDFDDGTDSRDMEPAHTFRSAGKYNVKLTVQDNNGGINTTSRTVTVTNFPVDEREPLLNVDFWVFGSCAIILLVVIVFTAGPNRVPPPVKRSRPAKKATARKLRKTKH